MTSEPNGLKADLVLSGGGVKGIGLAGAAVALLEAGYSIQRVSGTSAGSVVGAILAAGADELTPEQVEQLTMTLPYKKFLDPTRLTGIPLLGPAWGVLSETGIYKGDYAHEWIRSELANLGVRTFGDLAIDDAESAARTALPAGGHRDRRDDRPDGPPAVGLPQALRARPRRATGRRCGARLDVDPVLLPRPPS